MKATENMLNNFYCELCHYKCCKKSSWRQHILTAKHIKATNGLIPATNKYACEHCTKNFKHHSKACHSKSPNKWQAYNGIIQTNSTTRH